MYFIIIGSCAFLFGVITLYEHPTRAETELFTFCFVVGITVVLKAAKRLI